MGTIVSKKNRKLFFLRESEVYVIEQIWCTISTIQQNSRIWFFLFFLIQFASRKFFQDFSKFFEFFRNFSKKSEILEIFGKISMLQRSFFKNKKTALTPKPQNPSVINNIYFIYFHTSSKPWEPSNTSKSILFGGHEVTSLGQVKLNYLNYNIF